MLFLTCHFLFWRRLEYFNRNIQINLFLVSEKKHFNILSCLTTTVFLKIRSVCWCACSLSSVWQMCFFLFVFFGLLLLTFLSEHQMVEAFKLSSKTKLWQVNQKFNIYLTLTRLFIIVWCSASLLVFFCQEAHKKWLYWHITHVHVGFSWCWAFIIQCSRTGERILNLSFLWIISCIFPQCQTDGLGLMWCLSLKVYSQVVHFCLTCFYSFVVLLKNLRNFPQGGWSFVDLFQLLLAKIAKGTLISEHQKAVLWNCVGDIHVRWFVICQVSCFSLWFTVARLDCNSLN